LRLKQLERNIPVRKIVFAIFLFVARNSCAKCILSTAFASLGERVILPNVRFLRHYSLPNICLEDFCAFRWPPRVDYPLQRNSISQKRYRRSMKLRSIIDTHRELSQYYMFLIWNVRNYACHIWCFKPLWHTIILYIFKISIFYTFRWTGFNVIINFKQYFKNTCVLFAITSLFFTLTRKNCKKFQIKSCKISTKQLIHSSYQQSVVRNTIINELLSSSNQGSDIGSENRRARRDQLREQQNASSEDRFRHESRDSQVLEMPSISTNGEAAILPSVHVRR